jgi:hypothetical protein
MKILYSTLFPKMPFNQHEDLNFKYFQDTIKYYGYEDIFNFASVTFHKETFEWIESNYKENSRHIGLNTFEKQLNEIRAHEIAQGKSYLLNYCSELLDLIDIDYLFYTDADIKIDSKDVVELCKALEHKENTFINIPYALRDVKGVSPKSFGCYIIPKYIILDNPYLYRCIYDIEEKDGILYRIGAPDVNLRDELLRLGYNEIFATSCNTKHYLNNINYIEYESNRIKEF